MYTLAKSCCVAGFQLAIVAVFVATLAGLGFSLSGVWLLPKCRYGDNECYFGVNICVVPDSVEQQSDIDQTAEPICTLETRQRAIEGSSSHPLLGSEQLAIPLFALLVSCVPAILAAATVFVQRSIALLDAGKLVLAVTLSMLCISVDILQRKTFDCRWWHDSHHGNAEACKQGLSLYVVGSLLIILSQIGLLILFTRMYEWEMSDLLQMRISCLTNSGMSMIQQGRYDEAIVCCSKAINLDRACVNAHFRRAVALSRLLRWDEAVCGLEVALALQPGNTAVEWELEQCRKHLGAWGDGGGVLMSDDENDEDGEDGENVDEPLLPVKKVRFAVPMHPSLLD